MSRPSSPRLACILLWYPLFTQPFIFREIEGIRVHLPVTVYTLYGKNLAHCSDAMKERAHDVRTHGITFLPRLLLALFRELIRAPRRFLSLFREALCRPWPNLEIFGENLWAFCMAFPLARTLERDNINIIYAPWPRGTAMTALVIHRLTGIPFATTVRGDNLCPADPDLAWKMGEAALVRANNAADQVRIEAFGNGEARGRTCLVYNSLTLTETPPESPSILSYNSARPLRLMALGRFDVTKGFDVLIRSCAILRDRGLSFTLTLAGGGGIAMGLGKLEGELRALTAELGLSDRISYPGLLSHNELPTIFSAHDIFLAPCVIDASGRRDGIPNTVIEAMSMGMPVIASAIHALPELVEDGVTGLTVPQKDPDALARAVTKLAGDPGFAAELGKNAIKKVHTLFDPEVNCAKLAAILASLAKDTSSCAE
ncbi:MAG: glycosyltransferase family 4 protein [Desulfovibrio sp.]|nr:glycosyltransferase family 4 protein [Desulfovibrio sp.]